MKKIFRLIPILLLAVGALISFSGCAKPPTCTPNVVQNPFSHSAQVGFNCGNRVVTITATLNTVPGGTIEGGRWTGLANGNYPAIFLQHYCRWDFSKNHTEFVSAAVYQGSTQVGGYQGPAINVGACG